MNNPKKDDHPKSIREMIEDQIDLIKNAVMGENVKELVKTAEKIFANLPGDEIKDEDIIYFTVNHEVGLMIKKGENMYWLQGDYVVRVRKSKLGTITEAFKKGKMIASDVLPPARNN